MRCYVCGNHYDRSFQVVFEGETYSFDCFECAVHALAPGCANCGCKVIGHGTDLDDRLYCCAHCAREATNLEVHPTSTAERT